MAKQNVPTFPCKLIHDLAFLLSIFFYKTYQSLTVSGIQNAKFLSNSVKRLIKIDKVKCMPEKEVKNLLRRGIEGAGVVLVPVVKRISNVEIAYFSQI